MTQELQKQLESILNSALGIFQIIATFLVAFLVLLWLTLCVWTFRDIQSRTRDIIAQIFATLLVLVFNLPGVLLYMLVRPKETLAQGYERNLQEEYMLQDLEEREICPTCRVKTSPEFQYCFNCRTRLRRECTNCSQLIKLKWAACPYCGTAHKARTRETPATTAATSNMLTPRATPPGRPVANPASGNTPPNPVSYAPETVALPYNEKAPASNPTASYAADAGENAVYRPQPEANGYNTTRLNNGGAVATPGVNEAADPLADEFSPYQPPRQRRRRPEE